MLPPLKDDDGKFKYRVVISDIEYEKLTKIKSEAQCLNCEELTDYSKIRIFDMVNPLIIGILSKAISSKVWVCPKCHKDNPILDTNILETKLKEPYFLGTIPKPPRRKDGLNDRGSYARRVTQWAWNFVNELEESSTRFREDYRNADEAERDRMDFDGGEEAE